MKIVQLYTPKDFKRLDKVLLYDVWYRQALTDKQVAKLFGVTPADVKKKREETGLRWLNSAIASISGGATFTSRTPLIEIHAPKDWDGNPILFKPGKHRSMPKSSDYDYTNDDVKAESNESKPAEPVEPISSEDAARVWQEMKQQERKDNLKEDDINIQIDENGQLCIDGVEYDIATKDNNNQSE